MFQPPAASNDTMRPALRIRRMNVVAGQQRYSHEPLQRGPQVAAHHDREPVDLAGEGERQAFELLVVLELDRVQAGELDGDGRGARDAVAV